VHGEFFGSTVELSSHSHGSLSQNLSESLAVSDAVKKVYHGLGVPKFKSHPSFWFCGNEAFLGAFHGEGNAHSRGNRVESKTVA
jgi:hypothetical protein